MTDEELIQTFESTSLPAEQFDHSAHVRVAWWYLRHSPLPEALARFTVALKRFAAAKGAAGKYHETITVAHMLVIGERLDGSRELSWTEFAAANPDLLSRTPSVLATYYSDSLLSSERARRVFLMPDRPTLPSRSRAASLRSARSHRLRPEPSDGDDQVIGRKLVEEA